MQNVVGRGMYFCHYNVVVFSLMWPVKKEAWKRSF